MAWPIRELQQACIGEGLTRFGFALGHQEKTRQSSEWRHWGWSFARPGRRPELLSRPETSTPSGNEMS